MSEARDIELAAVAARAGDVDWCLIGAERSRRDGAPHRRVPGAAASRSPPIRPSSWPASTARTGERLIDGATYLFTNEYEWALLQQKTG